MLYLYIIEFPFFIKNFSLKSLSLSNSLSNASSEAAH